MKYIITLETEADIISINTGMQPLLKAITDSGLPLTNYSIIESK